MALEQEPGTCGGARDSRTASELSGDESWQTVVEFLEVMEYHPVSRRRMPAPVTMLIIAVVLISLGVVSYINYLAPVDPGGRLGMALLLLIVVMAMLLLAWALPKGLFIQAFKFLQRWDWILIPFAAALAVLLSLLFVATLLVLRPGADREAEFVGSAIVVLLSLVTVFVLLAPVGVSVGLVSTRARVRAAIFTLWLGTLIALITLAGIAGVLHSDSLHWTVIAIPCVIALVTSHIARARAIDQSVNSLVTHLDRMRESGLAAIREGQATEFFHAARSFQISLDRRPRALAAKVRGHGVRELCRVADFTAVGNTDLSDAFKYPPQREAAQPLLGMSHVEFAFAVAQVADAALQQIDISYGPRHRKRGLDTRQILEAAPLPRPYKLR